MAEQTLASARARAVSSGFRANRAFIVESLVLLVFLALAVALVLQLFASAGITSRGAHAKSVALQLAGNAAERFAASPDPSVGPAFYDAEGQPVGQDDPAAAFRVSLDAAASATGAGTFYDVQVVVEPVGGGFLREPYTLVTARYVPQEDCLGAAGEGLLGGGPSGEGAAALPDADGLPDEGGVQ